MGVTVDASLVAEEGEDACEVWDVNRRSLLAFLACETQWRAVATMAALIWLGLDYASARPLYENKRGRIDHRRFADLRVMEAEALPILNAPRAAS